MLGQSFTQLVEDCLQRLDQGDDLQVILGDNPEYQDQLKPLLLVAMASRAFPVPVPNQTAQRQGRNQLLDEMSLLDEQHAFRKSPHIPAPARLAGKLVGTVRSRGLTHPSPGFRLGMVALVMVIGAGFLTLNASASGFSGEMINYFLTGYNRVIQVLSFDPNVFNGPEFSQIRFFPGGGISFENQVANKAIFLLDIDGEEDLFAAPDGNQAGAKNQHKNGLNQPGMAGAGVDNPGGNANSGLALGQDKDQDNSGLALGQTKDQDNNGLALGYDKDQDNNGLALGHDKDQDNPGLALGHDKDLQDKIKDDKIKDDQNLVEEED